MPHESVSPISPLTIFDALVLASAIQQAVNLSRFNFCLVTRRCKPRKGDLYLYLRVANQHIVLVLSRSGRDVASGQPAMASESEMVNAALFVFPKSKTPAQWCQFRRRRWNNVRQPRLADSRGLPHFGLQQA